MADHNHGSAEGNAFASMAVARLESAPQQIGWALEGVERFFVPPPRRWWRRNPSLGERARLLEDGLRSLVDISGDLLVFGVHAELALRGATAATNCLAGAFSRPQITDASTELTIREASEQADVAMPWTPTQLEQLLRQMAALSRRLSSATALIISSPTTSADIASGLQSVPILLRGLEEQYRGLADKVDNN